MPIGKKPVSDGTLYALIAFVGFFIVATTVAVIYYLKFEEQRGLSETAQKRLNEVANAAEVQKIGALVGTEQSGKSRLKTMLDYLDQTVGLIVPGLPADASAEVKVNDATTKVREAIANLARQNPDLNNIEPNSSLLQVTEKLSVSLQNMKSAEVSTKEQLETLQTRFDDYQKESLNKERAIQEEKDKFQSQYDKARSGYDELKGLLEKKTEDQVKDLYGKLDQERAGREEINKQLLRTQAEMRAAEERIQRILKEDVWPVRPPPDAEVKAFETDGKVILIDNQAKIVHINLGSEERVYKGLTFSVYDKNLPIPRDGRGKAEIEVYNVGDSVSAARIIRSDAKNPIVVDDLVANLIWSAKKTNSFVIAGDFDIEGLKGPDAVDKLQKLVEKWGGRIEKTVTVNTDFVVLGEPPDVPAKPTLEEAGTYPNAQEKYDSAVERLANYKQIQSQAESLSIPILNADRFLSFIGYKSMAGKPGAF
jgi:hypothetical protein